MVVIALPENNIAEFCCHEKKKNAEDEGYLVSTGSNVRAEKRERSFVIKGIPAVVFVLYLK